MLGALLVAEHVVDEDYVVRAIDRERMSSTAFTLAIPHTIGMAATRTSIGIVEPSIAWGDSRVQLVMLVAFSEPDRETFQMVFN